MPWILTFLYCAWVTLVLRGVSGAKNPYAISNCTATAACDLPADSCAVSQSTLLTYVNCVNAAAEDGSNLGNSTTSNCSALVPLRMNLLALLAGSPYPGSFVQTACQDFYYQISNLTVSCSDRLLENSTVDFVCEPPAHPPTTTAAPILTATPGTQVPPSSSPSGSFGSGSGSGSGSFPTQAPSTNAPSATTARPTVAPTPIPSTQRPFPPTPPPAPRTPAPAGVNYNFVAYFPYTFSSSTFVAQLSAFFTEVDPGVWIGSQQADGTVQFYFYGPNKISHADALLSMTSAELTQRFSILYLEATPRSEEVGGNGSSSSVAIGIGVASGVLVLLVILCVCICRKRSEERQDSQYTEELLSLQNRQKDRF
jgi:hypothetical protein